MVGGLLNQDVQQGDDADQAVITAGTINGGFAAGAGEDRLLWTGGIIRGSGVGMGADEDVADFRGLTPDELHQRPLDRRRRRRPTGWSGRAPPAPRQPHPELGALRADRGLRARPRRHAQARRRGPARGRPGRLYIDPTSTLRRLARRLAIVPGGVARKVLVTNEGRSTSPNTGTPDPTDRFTSTGTTTAADAGAGRLTLDTVLGGDGSPSDQLVIEGGTGSGSTGLESSSTPAAPASRPAATASGSSGGQRRDHPGRRLPRPPRARWWPARTSTTSSAAARRPAPPTTTGSSVPNPPSPPTPPSPPARRRRRRHRRHRRRRRHPRRHLLRRPPPGPPSPPHRRRRPRLRRRRLRRRRRRRLRRRPAPPPPGPPPEPTSGRRCRSTPRCRCMAAIYGREVLGTYHERMGVLPWPEDFARGAARARVWARLIGYDGHKDGEGDGPTAAELRPDLRRPPGRRSTSGARSATTASATAPASTPPSAAPTPSVEHERGPTEIDQRRRHQLRRLQPRRLLDAHRAGGLVRRRRAAGHLVRRRDVERPRRGRRRHPGLGPRRLGRGRLSLSALEDGWARRAAGAARLPDLRHRQLRRHRRRRQLQRH